MLAEKIWVYKNNPVSDVDIISEQAGISPLLSKLFLSRGINDINYIRDFINPSLDKLLDPFLLKDMDKAVERILKSIEQKEKILIYGDYDVDGTTATSILYNFIKTLDVCVDYFIPNRLEDGYGLSKSSIAKVYDYFPNIIITADCGTTSIEEIQQLKDSGIDVIVTDHHECTGQLPEAYAVVNPCRPDCTYPFKELAGVGVAYKLITALCIKLNLGNRYYNYLDLVALGTVADVVPLTEENRILVKYGIDLIENTSNIGLKALVESCILKDKKINSWTIGFVLGPRINAAGRTGDASRAVRLFTTNDEKEASDLVDELNEANKYRQDTEAEILEQVINHVETQIDLEREKVIVVSGDGWHHGIIGIVASKITDRYYRPCILISCEDGEGRGSGRSIEGFNLFTALSNQTSLLEKFGGHELAAGLTIKKENIQEFRSRINEYADEVLTHEHMIPKLRVDLPVSREDLTIQNIRELDKLAPFGAGNPSPVFICETLKIQSARTVGEGKHLKLGLDCEGSSFDAIGFNMGSLSETLNIGDSIEAACSLEINSWNSVDRIQFNLKDVVKDIETRTGNEYFYTLDRSMESCGLEDILDENQSEVWDLISGFNYIAINELIKLEDSYIILANTLEAVMELKEAFRNNSESIKKPLKICYTCFNSSKKDSPILLINPDPSMVDFSNFERVIFYGGWICTGYLKKLLEKVENSKIYINIKNDSKIFNADAIIPERRDLVAIYQYIKANFGNQIRVDDLFVLAEKISENYKININYFKLKKGLEILEQVDILEKSMTGKYGVSIVLKNTKQKANLESSILYRKLQSLKDNYGKLEA